MVFFFSLNLEMQSSTQSYNFELQLNALIISGFEKQIATDGTFANIFDIVDLS